MPRKCCWVIHGSLTSERKASTSPSSFINHSTVLLNRALKRQAPCLYKSCTSKFERSTGPELERVDALGLRAVDVIICMITRDFSVISMTSQASLSLSLSLSLPLTKVTDAQYRKRFRASYNYGSQENEHTDRHMDRHGITYDDRQPIHLTETKMVTESVWTMGPSQTLFWNWIDLILPQTDCLAPNL